MIKKILLFWMMANFVNMQVQGQVYYTKNGRIVFFSKTILENISAENNQVISIINIQTGEVRFSLLNRAFHFPKAKMEDDFNESYMESDRWPRSTFNGNIENSGNINFEDDGNHSVTVTGELTIHGVTRKIVIPGNIIIKDGKISASAAFKVLIKDFNIKIPSIVSNKIAEGVEVTVECLYQKK